MCLLSFYVSINNHHYDINLQECKLELCLANFGLSLSQLETDVFSSDEIVGRDIVYMEPHNRTRSRMFILVQLFSSG